MVEFDNLGPLENRIANVFLALNFSWKETLIKQIQNSKVSSHFLGSSFFVDFGVDIVCTPIEIRRRVPVTVLVDHGDPDCRYIIYSKDDNVLFKPSNSCSPTGFNIHIVDGYLVELEVYSLAGDILDFDTIFSGKYHCFIYEG